MITINGAGLVLAAIFPTDRIDSPADVLSLSTTGTIHVVVALVSFLSAIIGMFVFTRTFMSMAHWRSRARWLVFFPAGALALLFVQSEGPLVGILQRLLVLMIMGWIVLVAFRVRMNAASERGTYDRRIHA